MPEAVLTRFSAPVKVPPNVTVAALLTVKLARLALLVTVPTPVTPATCCAKPARSSVPVTDKRGRHGQRVGDRLGDGAVGDGGRLGCRCSPSTTRQLSDAVLGERQLAGERSREGIVDGIVDREGRRRRAGVGDRTDARDVGDLETESGQIEDAVDDQVGAIGTAPAIPCLSVPALTVVVPARCWRALT